MTARAGNAYRHPRAGWPASLLERLANSPAFARARQALMARLPFIVLRSAVRDVVYLTWLVDADAAQALAPPGTRLWRRAGTTPLTVLTYRHGHFGPAFLGPFRRLFPSPLQSNWRLYLERSPEAETGPATVLFLKNIMDSAPHALGTRLFSDVLQTHLAARFIHRRDGDLFSTQIEAGAGSAPALRCAARIAADKRLPAPFAPLFADWDDAVDYLCSQDAAVAPAAWCDKLAVADISLPIDLAQVLPLAATEVRCALPERLPALSEPLCFVVPAVDFRVLAERLLPPRLPAG